MSADSYIYESGVWKKVSDAYTYNGSSWNKVSTIYYWNGSVWKESFTGGFVLNKTFNTGQTNNFNIATEATAAGWDGTTIIIANLTIPSGAYLGSSSTSTYSLETTSMVASSIVNLTINSGGFLVGRGGTGGAGKASSMTGSSVTRAGGGGGGWHPGGSGPWTAAGGSGGGGSSNRYAYGASPVPAHPQAIAGTVNTGGGGGSCDTEVVLVVLGICLVVLGLSWWSW